MQFLRTSGRLVVIAMMACGGAHPAPAARVEPTRPAPAVHLAVIPAESDVFPRAAAAVNESLRAASVSGVDDKRLSKVSLEVVQLSIECVDQTAACYAAIGRSLSVNRLLFARIDRGAKRRQLKITVTLFDVDAPSAIRTQQQVFASDGDAAEGAAALVAEVVR